MWSINFLKQRKTFYDPTTCLSSEERLLQHNKNGPWGPKIGGGMNIFVTGGAGYLGSVLLPKLLVRGHQVKILDDGYFGLKHLKALRSQIEIIHGDLRQLRTDRKLRNDLLKDCDCIIHLAAISNDPSAELNSKLTEEVNCLATEDLACAAKEQGIKFIFSSSCAVYGSNEEEVDENGVLGPVTTYAQSKVKAEQSLLRLADRSWSPVILRNGTLYGLSSRMRFDLVLNIFAMCSVLYNEIKIFGNGEYWRPFLHVADCARAFVFFAEKNQCQTQIYNVAHQNLRVCDLIPIFQNLKPQLQTTYVKTDQKDERSYRVSAGRLKQEGFEMQVNVRTGIEEMIDALLLGLIRNPESIFYQNAKWMAELMEDGKLKQKSARRILVESIE